MNEKLLAYETGIHIGDGNMYCYNNRIYRVTYAGNLINEQGLYKAMLIPMIQKLYNTKPCYYERPEDNTVLVILNSKKVVEFKHNILGLPIGKKISISIPPMFSSNLKLACYCLRGIGDTDFSVNFKKDKQGIYCQPRIDFSTCSLQLLRDVSRILSLLGFTFALSKYLRRDKFIEYHVDIYGKYNLKKWLNEVGTDNPYIKVKIAVWKKLGYVPPRLTYYDYLKLL